MEKPDRPRLGFPCLFKAMRNLLTSWSVIALQDMGALSLTHTQIFLNMRGLWDSLSKAANKFLSPE